MEQPTMKFLADTRGQIECPICGSGVPHHHDAETVELERYARPAFEEWAQPRIKHMGKEGIGHIAVHYGAALYWTNRNHVGRYLENSVETAWVAFAAAWVASDAVSRRPQR